MRYDELVKEVGIYKPKTIMEIGSFRCARAERMIVEAQKHNKKIMYIGFDLFQDLDQEFRLYEGMGKAKQPDMSLCEQKLKSLNCDYQLIKGNTRDTLSNFFPLIQIDFVFIDGGHSPETIRSDWENVKRVCLKGAAIYFDDYYPNRLDMGAAFLEQELRDQGYDVSFLNATDEERMEGREVRIMKVII